MASKKSGYLIAAAFIGPGTITTASVAGATYGASLIWALVFSVIATIVLQDMAVRLGAATGNGLATNLQSLAKNRTFRWVISLLIISAIGIGNAAYEAGNLTGAAIGLNTLFDVGVTQSAGLMGLVAGALLWSGKYKLIEGVLVSLVGLMTLVFAVTLAFAGPDWTEVLSGAFSPKLDGEAMVIILALIGTTIVPYNLFLHASLVADEAKNQYIDDVMAQARKQSFTAIVIGGLITCIIMLTAMGAFYGRDIALTTSTMSQQLTPILGEYAAWFFAIGLFCAGITSAITAPLAGAYAVCGALGLSSDITSKAFRSVWITILLCGVLTTVIGLKPILAIVFAQATNGMLLPIVAVSLLLVMNRNEQLGPFKNRLLSNSVGAFVVTIVSAITLYKLWGLFTG